MTGTLLGEAGIVEPDPLSRMMGAILLGEGVLRRSATFVVIGGLRIPSLSKSGIRLDGGRSRRMANMDCSTSGVFRTRDRRPDVPGEHALAARATGEEGALQDEERTIANPDGPTGPSRRQVIVEA